MTACLCFVVFEACLMRVWLIHLQSYLRISSSAGFWLVQSHTSSTDLGASAQTGVDNDNEICVL